MSPDPVVRSSTPRSLVIPSELVPERAGTVAFLSNKQQHGDWLLPRLYRAVSFMGSVTIDLTKARVGPGTSQIELRSIFGNIEIYVPPELRIECDVSPVLGNVEAHLDSTTPPPPDAPVVRITGMALMANVEVKVVDPNAPNWLDRLTERLMG
ncbi:MAG TPA: LiaF domain-containing protein [Gemmatimonadaceae bacterium]|nr:LiaF domain-containing protein [Gemmatimonadaceae bacterium]